MGGAQFLLGLAQARREPGGVQGSIVAWFAVMVLLPWATFFIIAWVARLGSNQAGAAMVAAYTLADFLLLLWLMGWSGFGSLGWTFIVVGGLLAAVYNVLITRNLIQAVSPFLLGMICCG